MIRVTVNSVGISIDQATNASLVLNDLSTNTWTTNALTTPLSAYGPTFQSFWAVRAKYIGPL